MNTERQLSPVDDRDLPRPASTKEVEALQRAVRRAQARLASTRPVVQTDPSNMQDLRESFDRQTIES